MKHGENKGRSGQVVVALALMLLALVVLALVNIDVFLALRGKSRLGNAGDAAALAAARWQGITLNLIGDLNLERLDAVCRHADAPQLADEISAGILALQERIAFACPIMGLHAANLAAKRNNAPVDSGLTRLVDEAVSRAALMEPDPDSTWPDKWRDYADMLRQVSSYGMAAGCDNAHLLDPASDFSDGHPLHAKPFYEAVDGEDWCWFFLRDDMLSLLSSFQSWHPLGERRPVDYENPEFFGVGVHRAQFDLVRSYNVLLDIAAAYNLVNVTGDALGRAVALLSARALPWYAYDLREWRAWTEMDPSGPEQIPVLSSPKDEYDVFGAAAATRVVGGLDPLTPGVPKKAIVWTAAAKPFGFRDAAGAKEPVTSFGGAPFALITPDFSAVRLIPLAGASEARLGTSDSTWMEHVRIHVPAYMETGRTSKGCPWCAALDKWGDAGFRRRGVDWLSENSDQCIVTGGHGTLKGGTRHAH